MQHLERIGRDARTFVHDRMLDVQTARQRDRTLREHSRELGIDIYNDEQLLRWVINELVQYEAPPILNPAVAYSRIRDLALYLGTYDRDTESFVKQIEKGSDMRLPIYHMAVLSCHRQGSRYHEALEPVHQSQVRMAHMALVEDIAIFSQDLIIRLEDNGTFVFEYMSGLVGKPPHHWVAVYGVDSSFDDAAQV